MIKALCGIGLLIAADAAFAAEPVPLNADTFKPEKSILLIGLNWGRSWKCGKYENAQIERITFRKSPTVLLDLQTPSKIAVNDRFQSYAYVIEPGEYVLSGFDVKAARSMSDIGHLIGNEANLFEDSKPTGGTFTANPGEIVYIGHFGLDCGAEPFLWRFYLQDRTEFEGMVGGFRKKFPFLKQIPVEFRLFSTKTLGQPFSLADPIVK